MAPPTAPSPRAPTPTSPPPDPTFPAVLRPARVYVSPSSVLSSSRFVFYDDGTFALQYLFFEFSGTYSADGTNITLHFGGAGTGAWGAAGTLTDDSFTVKYNDIMQQSDFQDAVYMRAR